MVVFPYVNCLSKIKFFALSSKGIAINKRKRQTHQSQSRRFSCIVWPRTINSGVPLTNNERHYSYGLDLRLSTSAMLKCKNNGALLVLDRWNSQVKLFRPQIASFGCISCAASLGPLETKTRWEKQRKKVLNYWSLLSVPHDFAKFELCPDSLKSTFVLLL